MKSVEQIIQEAYAANSYLTNLVEGAKFVTGMGKGLTVPYATLNREGGAPMARSNANRIDRFVMRITVWANHATGAGLRDELKTYFDNWGSESSNPRVLSMRYLSDLPVEEDDGTWQFLIDFEVVTQER